MIPTKEEMQKMIKMHEKQIEDHTKNRQKYVRGFMEANKSSIRDEAELKKKADAWVDKMTQQWKDSLKALKIDFNRYYGSK